jgi:hypothetical protein
MVAGLSKVNPSMATYVLWCGRRASCRTALGSTVSRADRSSHSPRMPKAIRIAPPTMRNGFSNGPITLLTHRPASAAIEA